MPWIIKPCGYCKNEFTSQSWKGHERKFCSNSCRQNHLTKCRTEISTCIKKKKRLSICKGCMCIYWKRHADRKFCNYECYLSWKRKKSRDRFPAMPNKRLPDNGRHYKRLGKFRKNTPQTCEKCESRIKVEIHHLDGNAFYNPVDGSNWIKLCRKCHTWVHRASRRHRRLLNREECLKMPYEPYKRNRKKA